MLSKYHYWFPVNIKRGGPGRSDSRDCDTGRFTSAQEDVIQKILQ